MRYKVVASDVVSGAVADTFKTLMALIVANTAGHRLRLRSLSVGPSDDTPLDLPVAVRVNRTNNAAAGTVGSSQTTAQVAKTDPDSRDALSTVGLSYSAEPTTYEAYPQFQMDFNLRGGFIKEWSAEDAPRAKQNQTLGILVAPRTAAAVRVTISAEFEDGF